MKNFYILLIFIISCSSFSFGQTQILAIDQVETAGITPSGSALNTTSTGFTRGPGTLQGPSASNGGITWGGLGALDEASAIAGDEYLSWSITANADYVVNASKTEIVMARNGMNGPKFFRIFYSLDNFVTAGIPVIDASSVPEYSGTVNNMIRTSNTFNVTSSVGGTITFRIYAWKGTNELAQSYLRIFKIPTWSAFGIANVGARVIGSVAKRTTESNIISTFDPTDNVNNSLYNTATSGLTTANAIKIGEFTIQDGGNGLNDADPLATTLTNLGLSVSNFSNIAALAIFDGATNVSEVTTVTATTNFININSGNGITAADNSSKTFSVYATFKTVVTDNQQLQLTVSSATANSNGSLFTATNAGGASTSILGDDNRIEVTATDLQFIQQPSDTAITAVMTPSPSVKAMDSNGNLDVDYASAINLTTTGTFNVGNTISVIPNNGVATFDGLKFIQSGTGFVLNTSSALNDTESTSFDILAVAVAYTFNEGVWSPSDPNGISNAADNISVLSGNAILSVDTTIGNVDVNEFSALTINTGVTLDVKGALNMTSTNLNYSSLMSNGTILGTVNYNRHVNGGVGVEGSIGGPNGANDLISSPLISSQNFGEFAISNANIKSGIAEENMSRKLFGPFNKATGEYQIYDTDIPEDAAAPLISGVGYRAASSDNNGFIFTGSVNQDIVTNNIINSGPAFKSWNLVGNPYPTYVNVGAFLNYVVDPAAVPPVRNFDLLSLTSSAIYGYDGEASDGYLILNLNTPEINMAPGQGFLVPVDPAMVDAYDLTFAPSMRRIANSDDFILGRSLESINTHLKLKASIGTGNYYTDFYFNANSTSGMDRGYDAAVFNNRASSKALYSQLVENNTNVDIAIQSLAIEALGSDIVVPLGINASQGQQVSISISESNLPNNISVYLEDNEKGTFTLLNTVDYIFTPAANMNTTGRFFLRFTDNTLSTEDSNFSDLQIFTTTAPKALVIKGHLNETTNIALYDIQGRLVVSSQLKGNSFSNTVDVSGLSSGIYVVKLNNASQQKTQKVILK